MFVMTQISLEAFLVTITDIGRKSHHKMRSPYGLSVYCGWSKQQPLGATYHYIIVHAPPTRKKNITARPSSDDVVHFL